MVVGKMRLQISDIRIKIMIKEENRRQSKQQRQARQSQRKSKNTVTFSEGPKQHASFLVNSQSSNTNLSQKNTKSLKRFGSKPVIAPYTGFISEDTEGYSLDAKAKSVNKENFMMGNEKKKLKRIGKKAWVTAFKQTITQMQGRKDEKQGQIIPNKMSSNDFHQFQQNASEVKKNEPKLEEEAQKKINYEVAEKLKKTISEDELFVEHATSQIDQLSVNQNSQRFEESPVNSDADQTLESCAQKTQLFLEDEDDKRSDTITKSIEYQTYCINVNSHDSNTESIRKGSKLVRNSRMSRQSTNTQLQEFLLKVTSKRPSILKKENKTNEQSSFFKRPLSKQNNSLVQSNSFVSNSCEQNTTKKKNSTSQHNYKPLPEPNIFGEKILKKNLNNEQKLVKKGISEHHKKGSPNFTTTNLENIGIFGNQSQKCCSMVVPILSKIQQLKFLEPKQVTKYKSMHNSAHIPGQNKHYIKNTDKSALGSSMKRNHKQLEMNKYIQEAKSELKYGGYR